MRPIPFNVLAKMLGKRHPNQTLVQRASIDSRNILPGDLFFALPGAKVDGHQFLEEAASRGAVGAVVKDEFKGNAANLPLIPVSNVLDSLQELARQVLEKNRRQVIGITGSLGKTTTKDFTAALLSTIYKVYASPLSYNSQATLPLSILMADGDEDILILEMGMSKPGEMDKLISIAPPDIAVITSIAIQHTCNFSNGLEGIRNEKGKIFSHPQTKLGICHFDIEEYESISRIGTCNKLSFSLASKNVPYYLEIEPGGARIFPKNEPPVAIEIDLPVKPLFQNFLAAVVVARTLEVPWENIKKKSSSLLLPPMRFEKVKKKGILFINDAYNANPDSMKAALQSLPPPEKGCKVIAVLSEMTELGVYSESGHALVGQAALEKVDLLLCIGTSCSVMQKIWEGEKKPFELCKTKEDLLLSLKEKAKSGDVVLIKGSRSYALEKILEGF